LRLEQGLIHYYHGNGKGKTSTLIGSLIRAHGHGLKVILIQFLKLHDEKESVKGFFMGEIHFLKEIIPVKQFGSGKFVYTSDSALLKDIEKAQEGLFCVKEAVLSGQYDMVAIDEIVDAIDLGLIDLEDFIDILEVKPRHVEILFTGYKFIESLEEIADYVTEIEMVKHPYYAGMDARKGIEF
jgi:cob(I)alamin adenosyltransferase